MKRQRGRGRKPGNPANRTYESNGPEVKIRGNASQIYDKYLQLARDATSSGDRVRAENLYQHAEHYYRIIQTNQPKRETPADEGEENAEAVGEGEDGEAPAAREPREPREPRRGRGRRRNNDDRTPEEGAESGAADADPLGVVTPEGDAPAAAAEASDETADEAPRRRTRRPRRPRAEKAEAAEGAEAASDAEASSGSDSESEAA